MVFLEAVISDFLASKRFAKMRSVFNETTIVATIRHDRSKYNNREFSLYEPLLVWAVVPHLKKNKRTVV